MSAKPRREKDQRGKTPSEYGVVVQPGTLRLGDRKRIVGVASGWHTHVGILIDHLHLREPRPFWTTISRLEEEYEKRIAAE